MNAVEIEQAVSALAEQPFDAQEFPFAFLRAFGNKETTLKRLRKGESNKSDLDGVLQTNNIHIAVAARGEVAETLARLEASPATGKAKAKFVLATDGEWFEAEDLGSDAAPIACEIKDRFGHSVIPREWFLVPLFVVDEAVDRIKNGTIIGYVYDPKTAAWSDKNCRQPGASSWCKMSPVAARHARRRNRGAGDLASVGREEVGGGGRRFAKLKKRFCGGTEFPPSRGWPGPGRSAADDQNPRWSLPPRKRGWDDRWEARPPGIFNAPRIFTTSPSK